MVVWFGRLSGGVMFLVGTSQVLPIPPPPSMWQGLSALFLSMTAMVPITIGEFIAVYLAMLKTIPINPRGIDDAARLQRQVFDLLNNAANSIGKLFSATTGPRSSDKSDAGPRSNDRKDEVSRERTTQP
jgi:hypothetical protein